jgi:electron transfer flavoprotein beta subunit
LEEDGGPFDLLLFGNESADSGGFQVGIRVAHALGRPIVNGVKGIEPAGDTVRLQRDTDAGRETYELPLPAAAGVKEGINLPRYPTMKGRLASKRVEITRVDGAATEQGGQRMVRLQRPVERDSSTVILGHGAAAAPAVVDLLAELGVLR